LEESKELRSDINDRLEAAYIKSKDHHFDAEEWNTTEWESIKVLDKNAAKSSGVPVAHLKDLGLKISHLPKELEFHK
jgi:2-oxoglutarate dehydrogenase complex dehydrogenase (E1) component-like enzyme